MNLGEPNPKYDPEKHLIVGVCKTTQKECKICVAITRGHKRRHCRWAFSEYTGHIMNRIEEDNN